MYVRVHIIMIKKNTKQTNNKYTLKHKNTHKINTKNQRKTTTKIPLKYFHVTVLIIIKSVKLYIYLLCPIHMFNKQQSIHVKKRPNDDIYLMDTLMIRSSMMI